MQAVHRSVAVVIRMLALCCLTLVLPATAWSQSTTPPYSPILYQLVAGSTYQHGCYEPCACPITAEIPVRGTFLLSPTHSDPLFRHFEITDVDWTVEMSNSEVLHVTGSGTYRVGGEFAAMHQLELDLAIDDQPVEHFDSGLIIGGAEFPAISITISINGMYCLDTVFHVEARPSSTPPQVPRHAQFAVSPAESSVELTLFVGTGRSKLLGTLRLFLGDPEVRVIALPGMVGLSVDAAQFIAPDFEPDLIAVEEPLVMTLDPCVKSIGSWNTLTGVIGFDLHLIAPDGNLPVPQPVRLSGTLSNAGLVVEGDNGNVPDGTMRMKITAFEVPDPPAPKDVWFSTESGFHAVTIRPPVDAAPFVSPGDLLSQRGFIVRTNHELTGRLGIMPIVPDLGLDAVVIGPKGQIWFSFEEAFGQQWSETLGRYLRHGDLLSNAGFVVRSNAQLLARFGPMPAAADMGLDAVTLAPRRQIWFSTEHSFFSQSLGVHVGHGDLLSHRGRIVKTNAELLANFHPVPTPGSPLPADYGLDAVLLRPESNEIWFSTEIGFHDTVLGPISDGDLLSTSGRVVVRNLDLVNAFGPLEDVANFGLDAVSVVVPCHLDAFDRPYDVNENDFVGLDDLSEIKMQLFQPVTDANYRLDVNNDDFIGLDDLAEVKANLFTSPQPCP